MRNIYIATKVNGHDSPCRIDVFTGRLGLWESVTGDCDSRNVKSPAMSASIDTLLEEYRPHGIRQASTSYRVHAEEAGRIARRLGVEL